MFNKWPLTPPPAPEAEWDRKDYRNLLLFWFLPQVGVFRRMLTADGWEVSVSKDCYESSGRLYAVCRFKGHGVVVHHPVYRSSGTATPELTRQGDWLPCSGKYPDGWVGKEIFWSKGDQGDLTTYRWYKHMKEVWRLPRVWQAVLGYLRGYPRENFRAVERLIVYRGSWDPEHQQIAIHVSGQRSRDVKWLPLSFGSWEQLLGDGD